MRKLSFWTKIMIGIGVVVVFALLLSKQYQIKMYKHYTDLADSYRYTNLKLIKRNIQSAQDGKNSLIEGLFIFQAPWGSMHKKTIDRVAGKESYTFPNVILVIDERESNFYTSTIVESGNCLKRRAFDRTYGKNLSDFQLRRLILDSHPDMLSQTNKAVLNQINHQLLNQKSLSLVPAGEDGIFVFETAKIQGFQFGAPGISDTIWLEVYYQKKLYLIQIFGPVTQEEVDYFITSIKSAD